jgi:dienelactone hydrolase
MNCAVIKLLLFIPEISYPNAMHSFTNPDADMYATKFNMPVGYNVDADKKSWVELDKFLAEIFEK